MYQRKKFIHIYIFFPFLAMIKNLLSAQETYLFFLTFYESRLISEKRLWQNFIENSSYFSFHFTLFTFHLQANARRNHKGKAWSEKPQSLFVEYLKRGISRAHRNAWRKKRWVQAQLSQFSPESYRLYCQNCKIGIK